MSDRPANRDVERHLAVIAKLREVDVDGECVALCDREELEWRRMAMDGYPQCEGGGVTLPGHSDAMIELLRRDPKAYFVALEPFRVQWSGVRGETRAVERKSRRWWR